MSRRKEPCRNFQRGSCQYGDRCKFLHVTQQQPKSSSSGFGSQNTSFFRTTPQQQPNPFGFGVQNSSHSKGAPNSGGGVQTKPIENKWTRGPSTAATNSTSSQQADNKQAAIHKCTDPNSCKQLIAEDSKNEQPLWKLTCYGHCKSGPCDIVGDISYEELRAAAYEDARKGLTLQSIIEREKSLLKFKLAEFDNLLRNPYVIRNSGSAEQKMFPGANNSASLVGSQNNTPPSFSSFSQLGASTYLGSNVRPQAPGAPANIVFGQPILSQSTGPSGTTFGQPNLSMSTSPSGTIFGQPNLSKSTSPSGTIFGQPNLSKSTSPSGTIFGQPNLSQSTNPSGTIFGQPNLSQSTSPSGTIFGQPNLSQSMSPSGAFGQPNLPQSTNPSGTIFGQLNLSQSTRPSGTIFGQPNLSQNNNSNSGGINTAGLFGSQLSSGSLLGSNSMSIQNGFMASGSNLSSTLVSPQFPNITNNHSSATDKQAVHPDDSIWLKKEWAIGEIPEQAPPERFC